MGKQSKLLAGIQAQMRWHAIPAAQIARAVAARRGVEPGEVHEYLAGRLGARGDRIVGSTIPEIIGDILQARWMEEEQITGRRRGRRYLAPRMPGISGREGSHWGLTREEFLDFVRRSQPGLVRQAEREAEIRRRRSERRLSVSRGCVVVL